MLCPPLPKPSRACPLASPRSPSPLSRPSSSSRSILALFAFSPFRIPHSPQNSSALAKAAVAVLVAAGAFLQSDSNPPQMRYNLDERVAPIRLDGALSLLPPSLTSQLYLLPGAQPWSSMSPPTRNRSNRPPDRPPSKLRSSYANRPNSLSPFLSSSFPSARWPRASARSRYAPGRRHSARRARPGEGRRCSSLRWREGRFPLEGRSPGRS